MKNSIKIQHELTILLNTILIYSVEISVVLIKWAYNGNNLLKIYKGAYDVLDEKNYFWLCQKVSTVSFLRLC